MPINIEVVAVLPGAGVIAVLPAQLHCHCLEFSTTPLNEEYDISQISKKGSWN
jgi:hypothetical protein